MSIIRTSCSFALTMSSTAMALRKQPSHNFPCNCERIGLTSVVVLSSGAIIKHSVWNSIKRDNWLSWGLAGLIYKTSLHLDLGEDPFVKSHDRRNVVFVAESERKTYQ